MNKSIIWAIARKDIRAITSNAQIWSAMIILPLLLCVIMPGAVIIAGKSVDLASLNGVDMIQTMIKNLPEGDLREMLLGLDSEKDQIIYMFVNYMLVPLFLLIPVLTSSMIAANSFVGEKERRTLESLLFAPMEIRDLFIGKVLASFIPTMAISLGSFILCGIVVDSLTFSRFDQLIFPSWNWLIMILWIVPILSLVTILFNVLISARVKGFQEAQQLGGVIVLPVIGLMISQTMGLFLINPAILLIAGAALLIICLFLLNKIAKMNQRHVLFERQVH